MYKHRRLGEGNHGYRFPGFTWGGHSLQMLSISLTLLFSFTLFCFWRLLVGLWRFLTFLHDFKCCKAALGFLAVGVIVGYVVMFLGVQNGRYW